MNNELLTSADVIAYLRLDADGGNARERLRNLIRRHGLPTIRRGGLRRFRRSDIDRWLAGDTRKKPTKKAAKQPAIEPARVTASIASPKRLAKSSGKTVTTKSRAVGAQKQVENGR